MTRENEFNILIGCAGRRTDLVMGFRKALAGRGRIVASDMNAHAAALAVADHSIVCPPFDSPDYGSAMAEVCHKLRIRLLLTLNVNELRVLEARRESFAAIGTELVGAPLPSIDATLDKYATSELCRRHGLLCPETRLVEGAAAYAGLRLPVIAKPRRGSGSRGVRRIATREALSSFLQQADAEPYVLQKFVEGQEVGFDVINDLKGRFGAVLVRRKLAMHHGETDVAETLDPSPYVEVARKISEALRHQGTIDVDAIENDAGIWVLDINLRFGGGYAFSAFAGANLPAAIVAWATGQSIADSWLQAQPHVRAARVSTIFGASSDVL